MDERHDFDPQDEAFIDEAVKSGRYGSRGELLREGVRLLQEREAARARFDAEIRKGLASLDRGEGIPVDEAFERVRRSIREQRSDRTDPA
jgi:antitoxin ParD1/3/4